MVDFRDRVNKILKHCTNNFGECVEYYPRSGGIYKIRGIFDNDFQTIDPETEQVVSSNQSVLGVNLNDTSFELKTTDQVKVRNLMYKVIEVREDGQGGAQLLLHKCEHEKKVFKKKGARSS
jgi:hypothetical protein